MNTRPTPETDAFWEDGHLQRPTLTEAKEFARNLERQRDEAREELEAMREAIKEVSNFITSFEYNGNEKGTRCISCYSHCSERHRQDCVLQTALAKLKPYLP